jgi:hypothetical protein
LIETHKNNPAELVKALYEAKKGKYRGFVVVNEAYEKRCSDEWATPVIGFGKKNQIVTNNHASPAITLSDESVSGAASGYSIAVTWGAESPARSCGQRSMSITHGLNSDAVSIGNYSQSFTLSDGSNAIAMGDYSKACAMGKGIALALGFQSMAKIFDGGQMQLANWVTVESGKRTIKEMFTAKVGDTVKGVVIEPDYWYWLKEDVLYAKQEI